MQADIVCSDFGVRELRAEKEKGKWREDEGEERVCGGISVCVRYL